MEMGPVDDVEVARMASNLPAEFISLVQAQARNIGSFCNVMGVVTDYMIPRTTSKNEWQATMRLADLTFGGLGLQLVFFNEARSQVPEAQIGDVIIAEGVKVYSFRGDMQLISSKSRTDWTVIPLSGIVKPEQRKSICQRGKTMKHHRSEAAEAPTLHQQQWAITLAHSRDQTEAMDKHENKQTGTKTEISSDKSLSRAIDQKFSFIKDLQTDKFRNVTGQVVKIVQAGSSHHGDIIDIHIADYTAHPFLQDHQPSTGQDRFMEQYAWSGPYGRYTLKVECHEPHGSWIFNNVKPGQMVSLQNVRLKMNRDGSFLEGNMFPDKRYPKKVCAFRPPMDLPEVVSVLERRNSYQQRAVKNGQTNLLRVKDEDGKELPDKFLNHVTDAKKKKAKKAAKRSADEEADIESPQELVRRRKDPNLNQSIQVTQLADGTGLCRMNDIINNPCRVLKHNGLNRSLPFVNCKYMLQMRVVDFYPHDIQDFCIRKKVHSKGKTETKWIWGFYLAIEAVRDSEDACKDHLLVEVSHQEANQFLGLRPTNLRSEDNRKLYGQLIRKLRLLWGDLDEVKESYFATSKLDVSTHKGLVYKDGIEVQGNRPFEGCIEEFGEAVRPQSSTDQAANQHIHWQRHYKLCETAIN